MKKVLGVVVAAVALTTMTVSANPAEVMPINTDANQEASVLTSFASRYTTTYGKITEVNKEENYFVVESDDKAQMRFNYNDSTYMLSSDLSSSYDLSSRKTDRVIVYHNLATTRSAVPQSFACAVVGNVENDMGNPIYTEVEKVTKTDEGLIITTEGGLKEITVSKDADVSAYKTKNIVALADIEEGSKVLLWYDMTTMSIPAYANTEKVVILPVMDKAEVENVITVNDKEITLKDGEETYMEGEIKMLPLRTVAEGLGFEVNWSEETQSIMVVKQAFSSMLRIDNTEAGINKSRLVLDTKPVIKGDKTYVPATYFDALAEVE